MKHIIIFISLSIIGNSISASDTGVLYLKKIKGNLIWVEKGNEKKHWKYKGEIKNMKPDGTGILNSNYGEYVGELKNGMLHGQGTYTYKSGRTKVGEFKRGKPWNVKNYNKDGVLEEEWINGKKIKVKKISVVKDKDPDFGKDFRVRSLFGRTTGESITSNSSLLLIWKNFGIGLNQMSFESTSSKNILYEMKNSSLDFSYTLFVKDYTLTSGVGYTYEGQGDITVESSSANYATEEVSGYGVFGIFGMQWYEIEALIGFRYNTIDHKDFKGTNTSEALTHQVSFFNLEEQYSISGSTFQIGIGYNF